MTAFTYALITACIWGIVPLLEKVGLCNVNPVVGLFYRGLGALIGMSIIGIGYAASGISLKADMKSICFLVAGGLLAGFIAQFFFYRAIKMGDVSIIVPIIAAYPLISFLLGVIVLREQISPGKILGMIMVMAGIFLLKGK